MKYFTYTFKTTMDKAAFGIALQKYSAVLYCVLVQLVCTVLYCTALYCNFIDIEVSLLFHIGVSRNFRNTGLKENRPLLKNLQFSVIHSCVTNGCDSWALPSRLIQLIFSNKLLNVKKMMLPQYTPTGHLFINSETCIMEA